MIDQLVTTIREAALSDTSLSDWCSQTYGQSPTFFTGIDERNPPDESDYPVIVFVGSQSSRSRKDKFIQSVLHFGLAIVDDDTEEGSGTVLLGQTRVDRFRVLFEDVVFKAVSGQIEVEGESGDAFPPVFTGAVRVTIDTPKSYMAGMSGANI